MGYKGTHGLLINSSARAILYFSMITHYYRRELFGINKGRPSRHKIGRRPLLSHAKGYFSACAAKMDMRMLPGYRAHHAFDISYYFHFQVVSSRRMRRDNTRTVYVSLPDDHHARYAQQYLPPTYVY